MNMKTLKKWIAWIFKIPQTFVIRYRVGDKKILVISEAVRGKKTKVKRFLVEHSVDKNLEFTDEMLTQENEDFQSLSE